MLNLRERRLELGLTMLEVAQAVGVSEAAISRYENGHIKNMGRDKITNYAKILQVEPNCLICDGIAVGIGDDNEGEAWTPAEDEQEIDFDLSYQRFKGLIRERKQHMDRLMEINAELLMYRDVCDCILIDLKDGGIEK